MKNKNFDEQIEKALETYKKMVKQYFKFKHMSNLLSNEREYIFRKSKLEKYDASLEIENIDKKLKALKERQENLSQKIREIYSFEVSYETIMKAIYKHLAKIYDKNDIESVWKVVSSEKYTISYFEEDVDYWRNKYSLGYIVKDKKYLLPQVSLDERTNCDAYTALWNSKRQFNLITLMGGEENCFDGKDWQEIFWGLVKENMVEEVKDIAQRYEKEIKQIKKYYYEELQKVLLNKDEENEFEEDEF